jgi:predicted nucleic acid-binding protein
VKILPDTNIWIGFFRDPGQREKFEERTHRPLTFLSSVVALELFAGCRTQRQEKAVSDFVKQFEKANRVITPDHACFREAGQVLAGLGKDGIELAHRRQMTNHILIAVTASRNGAVVVTANSGDFSRIDQYISVRWMLPDGPDL